MFAEVGPLVMDDKVFARAQDILNDDEEVRIFRNVRVTASNAIGIQPGTYNVNLRVETI